VDTRITTLADGDDIDALHYGGRRYLCQDSMRVPEDAYQVCFDNTMVLAPSREHPPSFGYCVSFTGAPMRSSICIRSFRTPDDGLNLVYSVTPATTDLVRYARQHGRHTDPAYQNRAGSATITVRATGGSLYVEDSFVVTVNAPASNRYSQCAKWARNGAGGMDAGFVLQVAPAVAGP
jgi:hypothetical protein